MRNVRLYIGGMRCDLDQATSFPFTFQVSDAQMPTSTRNSYSKTVVLAGTDNNMRIFGGLFKLDSRVTTVIPGDPGTPAVYAPWNQLINHGNFDAATGWTRYNTSTMSFSVADNVGIVNVTGTQRQPLMYRTISAANTHKIYWTHTLRITCATPRNFRSGRLYTPNQYFQSSAMSTNNFTDWRRLSGILTLDSAKTRIYVGFYGQTSSDTLAAGDKVEIKNVMLCDLTEIYGAGNEPTEAEFEQTYHLDEVEYYDYAAIGSQIEIAPATPGTPDKTGDIGIFYNPMKRVDFQLYVDEMVVERGYCQLTAINRKGGNYSFALSLFGGLGEFFYSLQTSDEGEKKTLADLDWSEDLSFQINAAKVQQVWDDIIGGTLPTVAFVPMHNGVPSDSIDAKKALVKGGGIPTSITDGGDTYTQKDGYLLASLQRKYNEWEMGADLRSYLQRPAIRLKSFLNACFNQANNGGWTVIPDSQWFDASNPYYEKTYILLPQLNVEESTDDICDDGKMTAVAQLMGTTPVQKTLTPTSGCMTISGDDIDMSSQASNAYLSVSLPVKTCLLSMSNYGDIYMNFRVAGTTLLYSFAYQAVAYDEDGTFLATSPRYVFCCKNHHGEVPASVLVKPTPVESTSDALIEGVWKYDFDNGQYVFRQDDTNADTFALTIDRIPRPSSAQKKVHVQVIFSRSVAYYDFNTHRKGSSRGRIDAEGNIINMSTMFQMNVLSGSNNFVKLIEPTQYASDSHVSQDALLNSLDCTPLELLLSVTKTFGLMWLQDNKDKTVRVMTRPVFYTGDIVDIHDRVDYNKGLKVTPVAAESNIYTLENEYPETDLSQAYESDYGRVYGGVRLKVGYDFGKDKVEMMEKVLLKGYVEGALSGSGYWTYTNGGGNLPSAIADGIKVTYYRESGGQTYTKDAEYNLFNVTSVVKKNSPALGVACLADDGEEKGVEVAPSLVLYAGGQMAATAYLSDDLAAMATLNNSPCWIWDESRTLARIPNFKRVATYSGDTYSLDFGTPRETYYLQEIALAPEQAIYSRYWKAYLDDLLDQDTKKVECYVVFPPHLDIKQEMRKFYLFDRSLWVLNKVTDYDATKEQSVKCEFIRVNDKNSYISY